MDPLSALTVASSVVTFVEFGGKLVSRFCEIRDSLKGQPLMVVDVEESVTELSSVAAEARQKVKGLESRYPRLSESLTHLNNECVEAENELSALLEKLTTKLRGSGLRALNANARVAVRALWSEKRVVEWQEKLDRIRNRTMMNVLMCLW